MPIVPKWIDMKYQILFPGEKKKEKYKFVVCLIGTESVKSWFNPESEVNLTLKVARIVVADT